MSLLWKREYRFCILACNFGYGLRLFYKLQRPALIHSTNTFCFLLPEWKVHWIYFMASFTEGKRLRHNGRGDCASFRMNKRFTSLNQVYDQWKSCRRRTTLYIVYRSMHMQDFPDPTKIIPALFEATGDNHLKNGFQFFIREYDRVECPHRLKR